MVVFNLLESSATLPEEQLKKCHMIIKNLITTRMILDSKDVISIYQLGNKTPDKTRPILIKTKFKKPSGIQSKQQKNRDIWI